MDDKEYEEFLAKHITTQEAMSLLGVKHRQQLYHWIKGDKLKPLKIEDKIPCLAKGGGKIQC